MVTVFELKGASGLIDDTLLSVRDRRGDPVVMTPDGQVMPLIVRLSHSAHIRNQKVRCEAYASLELSRILGFRGSFIKVPKEVSGKKISVERVWGKEFLEGKNELMYVGDRDLLEGRDELLLDVGSVHGLNGYVGTGEVVFLDLPNKGLITFEEAFPILAEGSAEEPNEHGEVWMQAAALKTVVEWECLKRAKKIDETTVRFVTMRTKRAVRDLERRFLTDSF
jgi:hypothetical protein